VCAGRRRERDRVAEAETGVGGEALVYGNSPRGGLPLYGRTEREYGEKYDEVAAQ
jgi:hypothetical protein